MKTKKKLVRSLSILLVVLTAILVQSLRKEPPAKPGLYRVTAVHDGDTVTVRTNDREEKVRLIGIDAPELAQKPWGGRAKAHLEEILSASDRTVSLEYDIEKQDRYGRRLAYLRTKGGEMVNQRMLKDGYAVLLTIPPNVRYVEALRKAQADARKGGLGIWGAGGLRETPKDYRERKRRGGLFDKRFQLCYNVLQRRAQ